MLKRIEKLVTNEFSNTLFLFVLKIAIAKIPKVWFM